MNSHPFSASSVLSACSWLRSRSRVMLSGALIAFVLTLVGAPAAGWAELLPSGRASIASEPGHGLRLAKIKRKKKRGGGEKKGRGDDESDEESAKGALPRDIKKEEGLAPKKEHTLGDDISQTKDLKPVEGAQNRPTLSAEELKRAETEKASDTKLDEEITISTQIIDIQTDCDEVSPVRARRADLYWEKAQRAFMKSEDFATAPGERSRHAAEDKRYKNLCVQDYEWIAEECPGYKEYPKILFNLGKALAQMDRAKEGAGYFKRIIKDFPDSEWVANAWYMVGEYFFNVANDAKKALDAYKKAAEYPKSSMFGFAIYKQGWCHVNTGEWDLAMDRFKQVVTISEDPSQDLDAKGRMSLKKEALKDYVRAFTNIGAPAGAVRAFLSLGGKENVQWMLESAGTWYINRDDHDAVITIFHELIKGYARSTRLAVYQGRVVDATSRMGDKKQTVVEVKKLTEFFQDLRKRVDKGELNGDEKKTISKDVREAEEIAENTLRRLAFEYYKDAKKLQGAKKSLGAAEEKMYRYALDLHRHYLIVFPEAKKDADVNYVFYMRFQYAEVLYKLEEFSEAAPNYDMVVDMNPHPTKPKEKEIVLAAAEESVRSYDEVVQDLDRKEPPKMCDVKECFDTKSVFEMKDKSICTQCFEPKPIPEIKQKLINSCQRYISYVGSEGEKIVEIRYKMARIYYTYNHFDEAAPAFNDIVKNHPANDVACYSANLVLDIYNIPIRTNYTALKEAARSYLDNKQLACGDEDKKKFAKIEESSSFLLIRSEYEEKKKFLAAANSYLQFYKDYPKSEFAGLAVNNAGVNFDLANKLDKANEVRRFLAEKMPVCQGTQKEGCVTEELVRDTLFNIAQSYERVVDFDNAAKYLEDFAKRFPTDKRAKDAMFNEALYRATLKDYAAGKAGRERYIEKYKNEDKEIYQVQWAICESLEEEARDLEAAVKGGKRELASQILPKWEQAHNCYFDYIKNSTYAKADADMLCTAQFRRGEIMRDKTNYDKGWQEQKKYLLGKWPEWKKLGVEKVPRCAAAIAEIMFKDLDPRKKKYMDMSINELNPTDAGKKKFDASLKSKVDERDRLIAEYKKVVEIGVAEWALASLHAIGAAYWDSEDALLKAPIPDKIPGYKLTAEDKELLRKQLREMAGPIEESSVEAFRLCVQKANELGVYNKWSVRSLDQLQKIRPEEYPPMLERTEQLHYVDAVTVIANGIVIAEGEGAYKPVELQFKVAAADKGKETPKAKETKDKAKKAAKPAAGAKPAAAAPAKTEPPAGLPEPEPTAAEGQSGGRR